MDKLIEIQSQLDQLVASIYEVRSYTSQSLPLNQNQEIFRITGKTLDICADIGLIIEREDEEDEKEEK